MCIWSVFDDTEWKLRSILGRDQACLRNGRDGAIFNKLTTSYLVSMYVIIGSLAGLHAWQGSR